MEICQGVALHVLPSKKFKDIGFYIRFLQPLTVESASVWSLLAMMMSDRLEAYPSKQAMSQHLDDLYGAGIGAQTIGYGKAQVLELHMKMMHPRFAQDGERYLSEGIAFLKEMLTRPLLNEECLQEAKRILHAKLKRLRDDAAQYAITQGLKLAAGTQPLAISALGESERIDQITLADIQAANRQLLEQSGVDIIVCGNLDALQMEERLRTLIAWKARAQRYLTHYVITRTQPFVQQVEVRSIPQSSIMQVYFTHTDVTDDDYYALRVMNAMLGQYSTSLLFQNVREKNSLCYSIQSSLIAFDGAMGITTGVKKKDIDTVLQLIEEQIETLRSGRFADELLTVTQTMIVHSLQAADDSMNAMAALQYQNDLLARHATSADIIHQVEKVTRDAVIAMAKRLEHKATYIVMSEEDADEADQE